MYFEKIEELIKYGFEDSLDKGVFLRNFSRAYAFGAPVLAFGGVILNLFLSESKYTIYFGTFVYLLMVCGYQIFITVEIFNLKAAIDSSII